MNIRKRKLYLKKYNTNIIVKKRKKKYLIEWEKKNEEKRKQYWINYYNKLEVKQRKKKNMEKWRKLNKQHEKEYRRTIGKKNNEAYRKTFKGKLSVRLNVQKRIARIRSIIHKFTKNEWIIKLEATKGYCPNCKRYIGIEELTLDHIYAVTLAYKDFLKTGSKRVYTINDIQPLCFKCNREKSSKLTK